MDTSNQKSKTKKTKKYRPRAKPFCNKRSCAQRRRRQREQSTTGDKMEIQVLDNIQWSTDELIEPTTFDVASEEAEYTTSLRTKASSFGSADKLVEPSIFDIAREETECTTPLRTKANGFGPADKFSEETEYTTPFHTEANSFGPAGGLIEPATSDVANEEAEYTTPLYTKANSCGLPDELIEPATSDVVSEEAEYTTLLHTNGGLHVSSVFSQEIPLSPWENSVEEENPGKSLPSGRFVCDLSYVIQQARELEKHSSKCNFKGAFIFEKYTALGLASIFHFICSNKQCGQVATIRTEKKNCSLNQLAVLGALSTGSGFDQEEEKFSTIGVRYMTRPTFSSCERTTDKVLKACVEDTLLSSVNEEKKFSESRNDVDSEGYHCITAIVDGGWCKRSYGHGYNASSGVAVIIGMHTQKILFIGVRNKVCLICQAVESGKIASKEHVCWKNWNGPSTAMESDIIVDGLNYLENVHHIRCTRLIGDGDTNMMTQIKENVRYGNRVMKIECANHVTRRYGRALEKLQESRLKYPTSIGVQARKILKNRIPRLVIGARASIKQHAVKNHNEITTEAIHNLVLELRNGPNHVFGKHSNCGTFCERKEVDPDGPVYSLMEDVGMLSAIRDVIDKILVPCSSTLIWNATNNPAENYMSQFCKATGGKRVDHSKAGGISRRANVAVLAYQTPAQAWHSKVHERVTGQSPNTPLASFLRRRQNRYLKRISRRKLFPIERTSRKIHIGKGGDKNYGDNPEKPDMNVDIFEKLSSDFLSSLEVSSNSEFEEMTKSQSLCEKWREERAKRISSTLFKDVADRRETTLSSNLVKRICYRDEISTAAMRYGKANEDIALKAYEEHTKNTVKLCGLYVDVEHPFLCTSPDGLIADDGLVEVKCPYTARASNNLAEICQSHDIGIKQLSDGSFYLPKKHKYFYQIQGQLAITKRSWCDLFVWCKADFALLKIDRDLDFWERILPKLGRFYISCILPELIDPRVVRGMPLREPQFILDAISAKNELKRTRKQKIPKEKDMSKAEQSPSGSETGRLQAIVIDNFTPVEKRVRKPKKIFDL